MHNAFPVLFLMFGAFALELCLLYSLARAWEKALSGRPTSKACRNGHPVRTQ